MWESSQSHCKPCSCEPCRRKKAVKMDAFLAESFKQFVVIRDQDAERAREVFSNVFDQIKEKMKKNSNYFRRYCKQVLYAGSVYDGTKVSNMNEYDMDIVIRLPINYDDIILENDQPGYLQLRITSAFDNLDKQPDWEKYHKVTRDWRDANKYLLQNKIRQWLQGIVTKAINELNGQVDVNGTIYLVTYKESGPAFTLQIRNNKGDEEFRLDVDLVPVIRFQQPRWPEGYSPPKLRHCDKTRDWLIVPKPNKAIVEERLKNRCWRLSFQSHEKYMMDGSQGLKTTIRLVKKMRDSLELKNIASYYIKTLFLWEINGALDKKYWCNKISVTFRGMVEKLYLGVKNKRIMYFWHPDNNLLEGVRPTLLQAYELKLKDVLDAIDNNDCEKLVSYLLTKEELIQFRKSEFYQRRVGSPPNSTILNPVQIALVPPEPFQFKNTLDNVASDWEKWKRSFNIFYEACELSNKEIKVQKNILLHVIGDQCRDIYHKFDEDSETVEQLLLKFDKVFSPKRNLILERQQFFNRDQKESESIEQYVAELCRMAVKCDFKNLSNDLIRDRLICGMKDMIMREKLLGEENLSSTKVIELCTSNAFSYILGAHNKISVTRTRVVDPDHNSASDDIAQGRCDESSSSPIIDNISYKAHGHLQTIFGQESCTWCGQIHRRGRCPAYGERCQKCKRMNHFAEVCRTRIFYEDSSESSTAADSSENSDTE